MRASLLTIGDELLSGKTINTNASWIGNEPHDQTDSVKAISVEIL